ncbi:MAG: hypothetical protein GX442_03840 [Candidatus Riflebacteria bacterium]|nr:hypothetical protein [Candidatus Riflebacteria bacterium]
MIEVIIVALIAAVILGTLMLLLSRTFFGSRKGFDTLSILQEESKLVAYLKHDFRTFIMGGGIPGPVVTDDAAGTTGFEFFKVETADVFGRPIPVKIRYSREGSGKTARALDGTLKTVYSLRRSDGTTTKTFMPDMVCLFRLGLLDRAGADSAATPLQTRKVRIEIESFASELLRTTANIYSPYVNKLASGPETAWLNNFQQQTYAPGMGIETYDGVVLDANVLLNIGPAIALDRERRF